MNTNPRSFQKFKKVPLFFSLLFLGASIYAFTFLYGQINSNKELSEQMQQQWQNEASRRSQIESLDRLIKSTTQEQALLQSHFAQSSDVVPFLDTIQKLATRVGASSEVVSVDILKDKNPTLVIEFKAAGSFDAIYKLLTLLENSPYELEFTYVDIQTTNTPDTSISSGTATTPVVKKASVSEWTGDFRIKLLSFIQ